MTSNSDKAILVSGASSGIGKASAGALLGAGFRVFACVRSDSAAETLERDLAADANGRLRTLRLDVTRPDQIRSAVTTVGAAVGERGLWGLFNNAGIVVAGPMECTPVDELRRQFEVNVFAQVAMTQAFLPLLRRARGRILNTGSIAGFGTVPGLGPYSMSKHAMEALSDALRRELRPWGIEVSLLEPGSIATEIWSKGADAFEANLKAPPPGLVELYGPLTRTLNQFAAQSARDASPVSVVTKDVVHAFTAARPRTRYCKGHGSGVRKVLRRLPDRWVDAVFARTLRWG
ncbi:MAG TPA: SDR family oxidoreductase [Steroidobacteraceae bacterium]|nr:SDR family oxidoreductase [Steroidobacteraceae bacterium]